MIWPFCQPNRSSKVDRILGAILPQSCVFCLQAPCDGPACASCIANLPWDHQATAPDSAWAAFRYEPVIANRIVGLKFHAQFAPAYVLGTLMAKRLAVRTAQLPELLIPVPLHPRRLMRRGYNQALEIGRHLAAAFDLTLAPQAARRARATAEQTRLTAAQRHRNLRGVFEVSDVVAGRHVALLDDVITTGATLGELAHAAREAGARHVELWAAARAELRRDPLRGGKVHGEAGEYRQA
jgi:ComF family protein